MPTTKHTTEFHFYFTRPAAKLPTMIDDEEEDPGSEEWVAKERDISLCPCKSKLPYAGCCQPFHHGKAKPDTAEQLMRARYSAYFFRLIDYLVETTHPDTRQPQLKLELKRIIHQANWSFLTIISTVRGGKEDKRGKVEFKADYYVDGDPYELHECSRFKRYKGAWKYLDGKT